MNPKRDLNSTTAISQVSSFLSCSSEQIRGTHTQRRLFPIGK
jgi:hypothetical protein